MNIKLVLADITKLEVDIIVNAAKSSLRGGSGVDGAIHIGAGPQLLAECISIGGCMTGDAKITKGYNLKAKHVVHTVGPVWEDGQNNEAKVLAECYTNCLILAEAANAKKIAFPCISTGGYGFPHKLAAQIALQTIENFKYKNVEQVIFCCYLEKDYKIYKKLLYPNIFKVIIMKLLGNKVYT